MNILKKKNWISDLFIADYTIYPPEETGLNSLLYAIIEIDSRENQNDEDTYDENYKEVTLKTFKNEFYNFFVTEDDAGDLAPNENFKGLKDKMPNLTLAFLKSMIDGNTLDLNKTVLKYLEDAFDYKFIILSESKFINKRNRGNPFDCVPNNGADYPFILLNKTGKEETLSGAKKTLVGYGLIRYNNEYVFNDIAEIGKNMMSAYLQFCQGAGLTQAQINAFVSNLRGYETKTPEEQQRINELYKTAFDRDKTNSRKERQAKAMAYRGVSKLIGEDQLFQGEETILGEAKGFAKTFLPSPTIARQNVIQGLKKLKTLRSRGQYFPPEFVEDVLKGKKIDYMKIREAAKKGDQLSKQIASRASCPLPRQYNEKNFIAANLKDLETEYKTCCRTDAQKASAYCTQIKKLADPDTEADMDEAKAYFRLEDKQSREKYVSILSDYYNNKCTGLTSVFRPKKCERALDVLTRIETGKGIEVGVEIIIETINYYLKMSVDYLAEKEDVFNEKYGKDSYNNMRGPDGFFRTKILPLYKGFMQITNQTLDNANAAYNSYSAANAAYAGQLARAPPLVSHTLGAKAIPGFYETFLESINDAAAGAAVPVAPQGAPADLGAAKKKDVEDSGLGRKILDLVDLGFMTAAKKDDLLTEIVNLRERIPPSETAVSNKIAEIDSTPNSPATNSRGAIDFLRNAAPTLEYKTKIAAAILGVVLSYAAYNSLFNPSNTSGGQRRNLKRKTRNRKGRRTKRRSNRGRVTRRRSRR